MKPVDFVVFDGDSYPNMPAYQLADAMQKDIKVLTSNGEALILSYYYSEKNQCMVLDIGDK